MKHREPLDSENDVPVLRHGGHRVGQDYYQIVDQEDCYCEDEEDMCEVGCASVGEVVVSKINHDQYESSRI